MRTLNRALGALVPSGWGSWKTVMAIMAAAVCMTEAAAQQRNSEDAASIAIQKRAELIRKADGAQATTAKSRAFNRQTLQITASSEVVPRLIEKEVALLHGPGAAAAKNTLNALSKVGDAFFICQDKNTKGFVVVSGDERMSDVLAYSLTDKLDVDSLPQGARALLLSYVANKLYLDSNIIPKKQNGGLARSHGFVLPTATGDGVGPLLSTEWGQSYPYNALCPYYDGTHQAVTGCVATTMAQAMNYYKFPTTGKGSHSYTSATSKLRLSKDFSATTFQWSSLKNTYPSSNVAQDQVNAIADLMLTCGVSVDMDYNAESGASQTDQMAALQKYFGYDNDMAIAHKDFMPLSAWHNLFVSELNALRPLMLSGYTTGGYGHAFIIDGYTPDGDDYPYYHVNWGWRGQGNGNYKMDNLQDSEHNTGVYSVQLAAIFNFMPDNGIVDNPSYLQIQSVESQSETVDLTNGETLSIDITQCMNGSVKPFTGTITFYLVDNTGARTAIQSLSLSDVGTSYYYTGIQNCSVPSSLPSGTYSFAATARASGNSKEQEIEIGDVGDSVVIINDKNIYYPSVQATALTASLSGSNVFSVSATNVGNFADTPFSGTLQMMVSDHYGKYITTFGPTHQVNNLAKYTHLITTYSFSGTLTQSLSDGAYRLNLGACQNGYNSWSAVKKYVISNNMITDLDIDATTPFWVNNGRLTLTCPYVEGDANQDGSLNVADLQALIRMILNNYSTRNFTFYASDLDVNARLNVADFSLLVPKVLNAAGSRGVAKSRSAFGNEDEAGNALVNVDGALMSSDDDGLTYRVDINLNNAGRPVNAMQFDISGDADIEILADSAATASRTRGFRITQNNGRVLLYNMDDANISGEQGTVLSLRLKRRAAQPQGAAHVGLSDIILSMGDDCSALRSRDVAFVLDANGVRTATDGLTGLDDATTLAGVEITGGQGVITIHSTESASVPVYSLDGKRVATATVLAGQTARIALPEGIYVVGNKKVTVR